MDGMGEMEAVTFRKIEEIRNQATLRINYIEKRSEEEISRIEFIDKCAEDYRGSFGKDNYEKIYGTIEDAIKGTEDVALGGVGRHRPKTLASSIKMGWVIGEYPPQLTENGRIVIETYFKNQDRPNIGTQTEIIKNSMNSYKLLD